MKRFVSRRPKKEDKKPDRKEETSKLLEEGEMLYSFRKLKRDNHKQASDYEPDFFYNLCILLLLCAV